MARYSVRSRSPWATRLRDWWIVHPESKDVATWPSEWLIVTISTIRSEARDGGSAAPFQWTRLSASRLRMEVMAARASPPLAQKIGIPLATESRAILRRCARAVHPPTHVSDSGRQACRPSVGRARGRQAVPGARPQPDLAFLDPGGRRGACLGPRGHRCRGQPGHHLRRPSGSPGRSTDTARHAAAGTRPAQRSRHRHLRGRRALRHAFPHRAGHPRHRADRRRATARPPGHPVR